MAAAAYNLKLLACQTGQPDIRGILRCPASPAIRHANFAQAFFNGLALF